jgi:hypothetical protein
MSNVPDIARYVMPACPRHESSFLKQSFQGQKHDSKAKNCLILDIFRPEYNHFSWSDPRSTAKPPCKEVLDEYEDLEDTGNGN